MTNEEFKLFQELEEKAALEAIEKMEEKSEPTQSKIVEHLNYHREERITEEEARIKQIIDNRDKELSEIQNELLFFMALPEEGSNHELEITNLITRTDQLNKDTSEKLSLRQDVINSLKKSGQPKLDTEPTNSENICLDNPSETENAVPYTTSTHLILTLSGFGDSTLTGEAPTDSTD